jgi:hydroxymethylpyrimidine pyrophosphatase-like HAD family hydrolase
MKTRLLAFTLSIFLCAGARAELKWEQQTIELHPAIGDKTAVAHFKYENIGKVPVHFKSVRASCGCTTTQTQKEVVNPGENGEITATFNIGDRTGMQMKTVTVQTDDPVPTQATTVLTLKANIPQPLEIKPTFVYWQMDEQPKPKKISIKASKDFQARQITVKSNNPAFDAKVEPGASGEWTVEVTPKDTSKPTATSLLIQTDYPKEAPKSFYVSAQVTNPPGAPRVFRAPNPVGTPAPAPAKSSTPLPIPSPPAGAQH